MTYEVAKDGIQTYAISKVPEMVGAKCAGSAGAAIEAAQASAFKKRPNLSRCPRGNENCFPGRKA